MPGPRNGRGSDTRAAMGGVSAPRRSRQQTSSSPGPPGRYGVAVPQTAEIYAAARCSCAESAAPELMLVDGFRQRQRRDRVLTEVDDYTRECLAMETDTSLSRWRVRRVLDRSADERGRPEANALDNGPEFRGRAMESWSEQRGVRLIFIEPGIPSVADLRPRHFKGGPGGRSDGRLSPSAH
jgi:transposase InsO family protein